MLLVFCLCFLASCGSSDDDNDATPTKDQSDTTTKDKEETFKVTFDLNYTEAAAPTTATVEKDSKATEPDKPTRDGYVFVNWYTDEATTKVFAFTKTPITDNITLYADWKKTEYTVMFDLDGGTGDATSQSQSIVDGQKVPEPKDPTKDGYDFEGWYENKEGTGTAFAFGTTTVTKAITLYAKWEAQRYFYVPDANFRAKLKALFPDALMNNDSLDTEHTSVTGFSGRIDVSGPLGENPNPIKSLDGIQFFTALTALSCSNNQLTSLDVSKNTALTNLQCRHNQLTVLDVSKNTALTDLYCYENQLTSLDVSNNTALTNLYCYENELTDLDVSKNTALTALSCSNNQLTSLDMRGMKTYSALFINAGLNGKNLITDLKVHENIKDNRKIKEAKTNRGEDITISTWKAAAGSTDYTQDCADYDPNTEMCN